MAWNTANSFKVQVLALSGVAADALYVYIANTHSGFLNNFDEPSHYSPSCPVAITYCRVPLASSNMITKRHRLLCAGSWSFFFLAIRYKILIPRAETNQEDSPSRVTNRVVCITSVCQLISNCSYSYGNTSR
ncbi:unnamed protein product [Penicillium egyptiacum]|uniref:Uncharacterized protein n=1 Tax=Penicillium egyptiacum TaxID=1303716 RepID=A0A9W4K395_9EURO|nr:unnamed protein product [Penicillium egyptiacum]